jgi:hypothetical protein
LTVKKDEMDGHRQELHKYIEAYYNKTWLLLDSIVY